MPDIATTAAGAQMLERVVVHGDLSKLTSAERLMYYRALCQSVNLNPLTRPFQYLTLSNRLTLYATKDATDQLRRLHEVSITKLERETTEGVYCVTAYAVNGKGRTDTSIGAVSIEGLRGEAKANAIMKAETKGKRRVTLSLCGLGMLDETEIETIPDVGRPTVDHDTGEIMTPETPDQEAGRLFPTPAEEDARAMLGRIEAGFAKLKLDEPSRRGAWSTHCGSAPYLSHDTDVAALSALLADLRARAKAGALMAFKDTARFYEISGRQLPSVTTILSVVSKPAIGPWMAKMERQAFETAMLEVATRHATISGEFLLDTVLDAVHGVKAADKARDSAANIGTQAHAMIEWLTRRMLGLDVDAEPVIADAAMIAVEAWKDWAKAVEFTPLHVEPVVYHEQYGYAGRCDVIAMIEDVKTLADYKSSKAVYPEAFLQVTAYRHAGASIGLDSDAGLILRLPKTFADPNFEAVPVPDAPLDDFLAALRLWTWQRRMAGQPVGG